jgi:hypothetical protein
MRPTRLGAIAFVFAIVTVLALHGPASAADPIFPAASRIGLVPPPGFVADRSFPGFRHGDKAASILVAELPDQAFATIEKQIAADLEKDAGTPVTRTDIALKDGATGFVLHGRPNSAQGPVLRWTLIAHVGKITAVVTAIVPEQIQDVASDEAIRASFATLTVRPDVPAQEQLAVLPFAMRDLGGFRIVRVAPGNAAVLTEGERDVIEIAEQPLLMIAIAPSQSMQTQPNERESIARRLFGDITGLKDVRVKRSEPLRVAGQQGHELMAEAKDAKSDVGVTSVQWLRFGAGTLLRIVAIARTDRWDEMYPRFRKVRDGIGSK